MDEKVENKVFKRLFWLLSILYILALWPSVSHAQSGYTTVTATVTDPYNNPYSNGTYIINFYNPNTGGNPPSLNGSGFQTSYSGALTSTGGLLLPLPDNGVIASSSNNPNTQWRFNICASDRLTCFNALITITGSSQNISATLKSSATPIPGLSGVNVLFTNLENPSPGTPAAGMGIVYFKSDKQLYYRNDTGAEIGPLGPSTAATAWAAITAGTNTNVGPFIASGNSWDWTGTTGFLLRIGAGLVTTINGDIGYDTTNKNWHVWQNGVDSYTFGGPVSATYVNADCVQFGVSGGVITLVDTGAACGSGGGGGGTFQVNGTNLTSSAIVNFQNSSATDGLTLGFSNPSAGNVKLTLSGSLTNAGLANPATTVNSQTCTLGSTCTIPFQHNSTNNTSQAGLNLETSTTNSVGLTATPTNSGTNVIKFEITGGAYTGTATNLSGTPALPNGTTATTQSLGDSSTDLATDAFVVANAGSFNNCMTTLGDLITGGASGLCSRLAGPSGPNGVPEILISLPSAGAATAQAWSVIGTPIDAQTGTSYTIVGTCTPTPCTVDRESLVTTNNASAIAITLPQAGTTNFANNFTFALADIGAGTATITPTTSTINGGSTLAIPDNYYAYCYSDNTNYRCGVFPSIAAFNITGLLRGGSTGFTASEISGDATTSGSNALTLATVNSNVGSFTNANITVNAKGLITAASNGTGGGGISGLTTGYIPKAASATSIANSLCDEGITTANTLTCTDTLGLTLAKVNAIGSGGGAGGIVLTQGTALGHATANTITIEPGASATAYEIVLPAISATGVLHLSNTSNVDTATISAINLASSDVTGQLPISAVGSAGLSATSPITISGAGVIACSTCATSNSLSSLTAATGANTIANGNNGAQVLNWAQTTNSQTAFTFGETTAATGGTVTNGNPNQILLQATTLAGSTESPFTIIQGATTQSVVIPALDIQTNWDNAAQVQQGIYEYVTNTASATGSDLINLHVGGTSEFSVDKAGNATINSSAIVPSVYQAIDAIGSGGGSQNINPANGDVQTITLSAGLTISFTQPTTGSTVMRLGIKQASSGGPYTITWTSVKWPGGVVPVMSTGASQIDWYSCLLDGTNTFCTAGQNFQ